MPPKTTVRTSESFRRAAKDIEAWAKKAKGGVGPSLRVAGEEIMTDVKASRPGRGVPVRTGALRSTGRVEGPTGEKKPVVTLSFGGAAAPYALDQHENLDYHHEVGEARYLVRGVERYAFNGSQAQKALKDSVDAATKAQWSKRKRMR
jgi:hypothetical protein